MTLIWICVVRHRHTQLCQQLTHTECSICLSLLLADRRCRWKAQNISKGLTYLGSWLSAHRYTFQFDFTIFGRNHKIALQYFRWFGWHQNCQRCKSRPNARLSCHRQKEKHFIFSNFSLVFLILVEVNGNSPCGPGPTWHWYFASSSNITGYMSNEKSPSSSLPTIEYRSKPLRFRCVPRPKSSFVHCNVPCLPITRHGRVTREPTMAVWSCGSIANTWLLFDRSSLDIFGVANDIAVCTMSTQTMRCHLHAATFILGWSIIMIIFLFCFACNRFSIRPCTDRALSFCSIVRIYWCVLFVSSDLRPAFIVSSESETKRENR